MTGRVKIIRSRRRTLALEIADDGAVVVRAPRRAPASWIDEMLRTNAGWIRARTRESLRRQAEARPKAFIEGETFLLLGQETPLTIDPDGRGLRLEEGRFILAAADRHRGAALFLAWYKRRAAVLFRATADRFAARMGLRYASIAVRDATTRWGSCGAGGSLNFNWKLMLSPMEAVAYVVVHELAHLAEKNHGPRFWRRVEAALPEFRRGRDWLKRHGHRLTV